MKIPKLTEIGDFFSMTTGRFPSTTAIFWTLFAVVTYSLHVDNQDNENELFRICLGLGILVPFSLIVKILGLKWESSWKNKVISFLILAIIYTLSYWFLVPEIGSNFIQPLKYSSVLISGHLILAIVPLFYKKSNNEIWHFNTSMLTRWLIGFFYCVIIFSGLAIALLAADNLFSIHVSTDAYLQLYFAVAFIVHPYYFLGLWKDGQLFKPLASQIESGFQVLMKYIIIPLVIIYFIILYAYGMKILLTFELPKGWVSSLILGFAGIAILSYLVNYLFPLNKAEQFLGTFDRWIFPAMIPLLPLLFIAILRRINEYGFTVERYVVFAFAIWLSITTIWFLWTKNRKLAFIPISLLIFIFIGFFSPVDAFHITIRSQTNRFIGILDSNKLIGPDRVIADVTNKFNTRQAQSLISIISTLDELNAIPDLPLKLKTGELNQSKLRKQLKIESLNGNSENGMDYNFSLINGEQISPHANQVYFFRVQQYDSSADWRILEGTCIIEAPDSIGIGKIDLTEYCKFLEKFGQNNNFQNTKRMSYTGKGSDGMPFILTFLSFSFNRTDNIYRVNSADGIASK